MFITKDTRGIPTTSEKKNYSILVSQILPKTIPADLTFRILSKNRGLDTFYHGI